MTEIPPGDQLLRHCCDEIRTWRDRLRQASEDLKAAPVPKTGTDAMVSLAVRVASIGSAGMLSAAEGDIYAARALARVASEHWVRLMAIADDVRTAGDQTAGEHYWEDLRRAEAIKADKLVREWFPQGTATPSLPDFVRRQIQELLLDPPPTPAESKSVPATIDKYSFKKIVRALLAPLPDKTADDQASFGSFDLTYPLLSGCIHAGPEAHKWLLSSDWTARLAAALDLALLWALVLVFVRTHLARGDRAATSVVQAQRLADEVTVWHDIAMTRVQIAIALVSRTEVPK